MKISTGSKSIFSLLSAVLLLAVWQGGASVVKAPIILPGPLETAAEFMALIQTSLFYKSVWATIQRGFIGFLIPLILGIVAGIFCGKFRSIEAFLSPFLTIIRSMPVMSIIILAMIWFKTSYVPIFVCFLTTFPIITAGVTEGVKRINRQMLELARIYQIRSRKLIFELYIPAIFPFILSSIRATLGLTWKVIVAAELLAQPRYAIGTGLQYANVNLFTAQVFAWTAIAVLLSWGSGKLVDGLTKKIPGASYAA